MTGHENYDHGGHEGHDHAHGSGRSFAIGTALDLGFVIVEVIYGVLANSMALVADAGHNLSDVLGLVMSWVAMLLARRRCATPSAWPLMLFL